MFKTRMILVKKRSILLQVDQMILEATWIIMLFDEVLGATWHFAKILVGLRFLDQLKMNPLLMGYVVIVQVVEIVNIDLVLTL